MASTLRLATVLRSAKELADWAERMELQLRAEEAEAEMEYARKK